MTAPRFVSGEKLAASKLNLLSDEIDGNYSFLNGARGSVLLGRSPVFAQVGDSITAVQTQFNVVGFTASGGTGPYTFGLTGQTAQLELRPATPTLFVNSRAGAIPGSYAVTITATDNLGATGTRQATITFDTPNTFTVTLGASAGALTVNYTDYRVRRSSRSLAWWLEARTNRRIQFPDNLCFAKSGDNSAACLARVSEAVVANCAGYTVMIGTNDINSVNNPSVAQVTSNIRAIWDALLATGRPVIAFTVLPRTLTVPAQNNNRAMLWGLNDWIRSQRGYSPNLIIIDPSADYVDPVSTTSSPRAGSVANLDYSYDGLHPNSVGAWACSQRAVSAINNLMPDLGAQAVSQGEQYDPTFIPRGNLITNPMMVGTGGTASGRASGTVPTTWELTTSDAGAAPATFTAVGSISALADGTRAAQVVVGGTATGGFGTFAAFKWLITDFSRFTAGDRLRASVRFEMDAGAANVTPPFISIFYTVSGVSYVLESGSIGWTSPNVGDGSPTVAYSGILNTPDNPPPLPAVPGGFLQILVGVYLTNTGTTPAATLRITGAALRKI